MWLGPFTIRLDDYDSARTATTQTCEVLTRELKQNTANRL